MLVLPLAPSTSLIPIFPSANLLPPDAQEIIAFYRFPHAPWGREGDVTRERVLPCLLPWLSRQQSSTRAPSPPPAAGSRGCPSPGFQFSQWVSKGPVKRGAAPASSASGRASLGVLEEPRKSSLLPWEKLIFKAIDVAFETQPAVRQHLDYLPFCAPAFVVLTSKKRCPAPRGRHLSPLLGAFAGPDCGSEPGGAGGGMGIMSGRGGSGVGMLPQAWGSIRMGGWGLLHLIPPRGSLMLQVPHRQLGSAVALGAPLGYHGPTRCWWGSRCDVFSWKSQLCAA